VPDVPTTDADTPAAAPATPPERPARPARRTRAAGRPPAATTALLAVLGTSVLAGFVVILRSIDRGFDWTDEAFVYGMMASNRIAVGEAWGFQHLFHPLWTALGESVLIFRGLRLVGYVLVSVLLVLAARSVLLRLGTRLSRSSWLVVLLVAQAGTFLPWAYPPRYFGHNELAAWFSQLGGALVVLALVHGRAAAGRRPRLVVALLWLALGACVSLLLLTKVTSGAAIGAVAAVAVLVPGTVLRWWQRVLALAAGALLPLVLAWWGSYPLGAYAHNIVTLFTDEQAQAEFGHPFGELVSTYIYSLGITGRVVAPILALFAVLAAVVLALRARSTVPPAAPGARAGDGSRPVDLHTLLGRSGWVLAVLTGVALATIAKTDTWAYLGALIAFAGAAGLIGLALTARVREAGRGVRGTDVAVVVVAVGALVGAPFASAAGTNNPIFGQMLFSATLWAVLLGLAAVLLGHRARAEGGLRVLAAVPAAVVLVLCTVAVQTSVDAPYRTAPLMSQETKNAAWELRGMRLTEPEAAWAGWVSHLGDELDADGVPTVTINQPGAAFLFNASDWANPWTSSIWPASFQAVRDACTQERPDGLLVLQPGTAVPGDPSYEGTVAALADCGIAFPDDFEQVAAYPSGDPFLQLTVWRLEGAGA